MKDVDDAIGRVMAGLRGAEAAPGLEERVERRVREAAALERGSVHGGWWPRGFGGLIEFNGVRMGGLVVCGLVVLIAAVELRSHRQGGFRAKNGSAVAVSPGRDEVARRSLHDGSEGSGPQKVKLMQKYLQSPGVTIAGVRGKAGPPAMRKDDKCVGGELSCGIGKGEESAASFPAPPMALTEQERLLLRVAHHGGPEEVAMLDPAMRAVQDGEETAAFQEFFGKPEEVSQMVQKVNQGESR